MFRTAAVFAAVLIFYGGKYIKNRVEYGSQGSGGGQGIPYSRF